VTVRVASRDDRWATAAYAYLREEIARNVPWWRSIRNPSLLYSLFSIILGVVLWNVGDVIAILTTPDGIFPEGVDMLALTIWFVLVVTGSTWLTSATRRYVRAFDLLREGQRARGKAIVTVCASSVGAVALSIIGAQLAEYLSAVGI
jgi:hypothetical protein